MTRPAWALSLALHAAALGLLVGFAGGDPPPRPQPWEVQLAAAPPPAPAETAAEQPAPPAKPQIGRAHV